MKTNIFLSLFLALASFASMAQVTKKPIEVPEFKSIYVNSNYTVYVKQTNKNEVSVEALTEIFTLTEIKVENGVLLINVERKPDNTNKSLWAKIDDIKLNPTMKIYVSMKNISELQVNAGGKIVSENSLASDNLLVAVNGSGSIDVDIKGNNVKAEVTGTGNLNLRGYASNLDVLVSGTGSLTGYNCPVETAKVKVSGAGLCELTVSNAIEALVMGSGSIKHKGNTKSTQKKVYGTGTIDRAY